MTEVTIVPIERLDLTFDPQWRWPYADARRAEIDAHFEMLRVRLPELWNGRALMLHEHTIKDGVFHGCFFETDFASLIAWRDWGWPDRSVINCFAQAALRSADGAFLLGVMAPHTANAGKIYFPSGTPEPADVIGGRVDLPGNMMRELAEETGIAGTELAASPDWHAVSDGTRIALLREMRSSEDAVALRARILGYLARERQPELADIHIARGPDDLLPAMTPFVTAFLTHIWQAR